MRTLRILLSLATAVGGGLATQSAASAQENRGTWEQQMACTPDVWRLCSDQIPDVDRIVTCLRQNTPQLSNNCRAVFESNASRPASAAADTATSGACTTTAGRAPCARRAADTGRTGAAQAL